MSEEIVIESCKIKAGVPQPEINDSGKKTGWMRSRFTCKDCPLYDGADTGHDFIFDSRSKGAENVVADGLRSNQRGCEGVRRRREVIERWRARQKNS